LGGLPPDEGLPSPGGGGGRGFVARRRGRGTGGKEPPDHTLYDSSSPRPEKGGAPQLGPHENALEEVKRKRTSIIASNEQINGGRGEMPLIRMRKKGDERWPAYVP